MLEALPHYLSDFQWEALRGTLMGDGALSPTRSGHGPGSATATARSRRRYADWKASLFSNLGASRHVRADGVVTYDFSRCPNWPRLRQGGLRRQGRRSSSDDYLKRLTPLSLALWYMDDAQFHHPFEGPAEADAGLTGPAPRSASRHGADDARAARGATWPTPGGSGRKLISSRSREEGRPRLHQRRDGEVPRPDRAVRAPEHGVQAATAIPGPLRASSRCSRPCATSSWRCRSTDIHVKPPTRSMHRFDIEVEDSHNYLVDGVVVHNSPEVTPGGRALKFYSSVRLDIRRIEAIKDGADVVGNRTRVKVVKNKCSAPFKQAEFDIMYGKGISREGSLLDVAVELGFVKKSGAWFTYEGEQLGQGRENVKTFLVENPQLMAEIDDRVRECLAPKDDADATPAEGVTRSRRRPDLARLLSSHPAPTHIRSLRAVPPLPRATVRSASRPDHNGAVPAGEWKRRVYRVLDRVVPTVPFRYLPPKQSVRMAFNVILDREPDPVGGAEYTQKLADGELSRHGVAEALAHSEEFRRRVPIGNVLLSMHVSRSEFVAGLPRAARILDLGRDAPGPARRGAGAPGLPLSLRAPGGGRPAGRGARRDLPGWFERRAGALRARAGGVRLPLHGRPRAATTTARSTSSTAASRLSTSARPTGTGGAGGVPGAGAGRLVLPRHAQRSGVAAALRRAR